jgi:hypothetical protein
MVAAPHGPAPVHTLETSPAVPAALAWTQWQQDLTGGEYARWYRDRDKCSTEMHRSLALPGIAISIDRGNNHAVGVLECLLRLPRDVSLTQPVLPLTRHARYEHGTNHRQGAGSGLRSSIVAESYALYAAERLW